MESEGQPGVALPASPLLSSQSPDQFHVLCVSSPPHREITRGVLYIVGFRSRQIHGVQDCKGCMRGKVGPTTWSAS
jgi:hypothetical protein